ncbi:MAG: hypothetical protein M3N59_02010 [bacterium]|nr:hypothetical protein [bacterium]
MPSTATVLNIRKGPGTWDYNMAVCQPHKDVVTFTADNGQTYEVRILENGVRAKNVRAFVGVTNVDQDGNFSRIGGQVWVTGVYALNGPPEGGLSIHGSVESSRPPELPAFGPVDYAPDVLQSVVKALSL